MQNKQPSKNKQTIMCFIDSILGKITACIFNGTQIVVGEYAERMIKRQPCRKIWFKKNSKGIAGHKTQ